MVAHKGGNFSTLVFPQTPTHDVLVSAGEALRGCDASEARVITDKMLEKLRMRAGITKQQVKAMGYRPRNAYCVMDMGEPAWTLTSCFTNPSGGWWERAETTIDVYRLGRARRYNPSGPPIISACLRRR